MEVLGTNSALLIRIGYNLHVLSKGFFEIHLSYRQRDAQQTAFIPPRWLFAVVWTILLVLMGTASYLVVSGKLNRTALIVYSVQPLFDFMWPLLFNMVQYLCAFIWPVVWGPLLITTFLFYRISKTRGVSCCLWATFADYLDFPFIC